LTVKYSPAIEKRGSRLLWHLELAVFSPVPFIAQTFTGIGVAFAVVTTIFIGAGVLVGRVLATVSGIAIFAIAFTGLGVASAVVAAVYIGALNGGLALIASITWTAFTFSVYTNPVNRTLYIIAGVGFLLLAPNTFITGFANAFAFYSIAGCCSCRVATQFCTNIGRLRRILATVSGVAVIANALTCLGVAGAMCAAVYVGTGIGG